MTRGERFVLSLTFVGIGLLAAGVHFAWMGTFLAAAVFWPRSA